MKGISLIEAIIAIAVFLLTMLAVTSFTFYFYRTSNYDFQQLAAINSARRGMEIMVREMREATYSDVGSYPIVEADDQSITFYSDIDKDDKVERIRYFLEDSKLKKEELESEGDPLQYQTGNEVVSLISENVRNGESNIFNYYDKNNNRIEDLEKVAEISLVEIRLVVNIDPNRPPEEYSLISNAQLRNLR